ncbi:hypothetical protein EVAR_9988_1 [Eumeta japonica]|uniref:Uncharacterized protein n=1 Tax=Eumeta variegata TaxID=151549 RepID=A0A4C1TR10_EUMVA|nr:hypothetical protein EVAR_9988_1 [Eumeta japonica]
MTYDMTQRFLDLTPTSKINDNNIFRKILSKTPAAECLPSGRDRRGVIVEGAGAPITSMTALTPVAYLNVIYHIYVINQRARTLYL